MNALANSLCAYLCSRNNDIAGYWGIGKLCAVAKKQATPKFSFKIYPGKPLRIDGYEISESNVVTDKLVKFGIDSIEGRMSFFLDGRYPYGAEKYTCGIAIVITQGGRTGMHICHVECWSHDPSRESCRNSHTSPTKATVNAPTAAVPAKPNPTLLERIKATLK